MLKNLLASIVMAAMSLMASAALNPTNVTPKEGKVSYASDFENVQLTFGAKVTVDTSVMPTLKNTTTGEVLTATSFAYWDFAYKMMSQHIVRVIFPDPTVNGDYVMTIPAGSIKNASTGESIGELTYEYNLLDDALTSITYKPVEMIATTPGQNTVIANLGGDYQFSFQTSDNSEINFLTWEFWEMESDVEGKEGEPNLMRQNNRNRYTLDGNMLATNTKDQWTENINFFVGGSEPLYEGKEYEMRVNFYAMGLTPSDVAAGIRNALPAPYEYEKSLVCQYTIKIKGGTKPYEFSDVTFTVDPDPDKYIIESVDNNIFTFYFTAPVECTDFTIALGNSTSMEGGTKEANETKDVWTLALSQSQIAACLQENSSILWSVGFNDMQGRRLLGNDGKFAGANSLTTYNTSCDGTTPHLMLVSPQPDENGTVSELTKIVVTNEKHIEMRAANASKTTYARLLNMQGAEIEVFDSFEIDPSDNSNVIFTLAKPITTGGNYILMIPDGIFLIMNGGEQGFSYNLPFDYKFIVQPAVAITTDFTPKSVDPAEGSTLSSLQAIELNFGETVELPETNGEHKKAALYKDEVLLEEVEVTFSPDFSKDYLGIVEFTQAYKEAGNYVVVIPEGAFCNEDYMSSVYEYGSINPELRYSYVVDGSLGISGVEAEEVVGDVYGIDGVLVLRAAKAADVQKLPAGFYIHAGKKVIVK